MNALQTMMAFNIDPKNRHALRKGDVVVAGRDMGTVCSKGERGLVVEEYTLVEGGEERPGWTIIFREGGYDGFSPYEAEHFLDEAGEHSLFGAAYEFKNVMRLQADWRRGAFTGVLGVPQKQTT